MRPFFCGLKYFVEKIVQYDLMFIKKRPKNNFEFTGFYFFIYMLVLKSSKRSKRKRLFMSYLIHVGDANIKKRQ